MTKMEERHVATIILTRALASVAVLFALAGADVPLKALTTSGGFLGQGWLPVFEIRDVDDGPVVIIVNREQGRALAEKLGERGGCLLARYGTIVVGDSIQQLVWRGICGERHAGSGSMLLDLEEFDILATLTQPTAPSMAPRTRKELGTG